MGKTTGFLEYEREMSQTTDPLERIKNFDEFHQPLSLEKQKEQAARCMDCGVPFCQAGLRLNGKITGCPLHNLIPETNDLLYHDHLQVALERLLKTNNFPEFTSRVCPHPCEYACTCALNGEGVSIQENERKIIEEGYLQGAMKAHRPAIQTGKKIAVIGSGPAGLTVADLLNARGHHVCVYEKDDAIGGLLRYGIPNMKLDKAIIDRRIRLMQESGVEFVVNHPITTKKQAQNLLKNYDRVVLACGAGKPRDIQVENRDAENIFFAVDFLTKSTKALKDPKLTQELKGLCENKKVLVIGGGDTGNDCVGTVIRLGCKDVYQLEILPPLPSTRHETNPWPEWPNVLKVDYGQEECIAKFGHDPRLYSKTVESFIVDKEHKVIGANVISTLSNKEVMKMDCDLVLIAAGFVGCKEEIVKAFDLSLNKKGLLDLHDNQKGIYSVGDMASGPSLVVLAMASGRQVAKEVDLSLMGYTNL